MTTLFARKPSPSATNCEAFGGQMKLLFLFWVTFKHWDIKKNFQKLSFQEPNRIQRDRDKSLLRLFFLLIRSNQVSEREQKTEERVLFNCSITRIGEEELSDSAAVEKWCWSFTVTKTSAAQALFFSGNEVLRWRIGRTWPFHKIRLLACTADHHRQDKEEEEGKAHGLFLPKMCPINLAPLVVG